MNKEKIDKELQGAEYLLKLVNSINEEALPTARVKNRRHFVGHLVATDELEELNEFDFNLKSGGIDKYTEPEKTPKSFSFTHLSRLDLLEQIKII